MTPSEAAVEMVKELVRLNLITKEQAREVLNEEDWKGVF